MGCFHKDQTTDDDLCLRTPISCERGQFEHLPSTWGGTKIDDTLGSGEDVVFFVKLDELEGGTGAVTMLLGHVIELIETPLGVLFLPSWHSPFIFG